MSKHDLRALAIEARNMAMYVNDLEGAQPERQMLYDLAWAIDEMLDERDAALAEAERMRGVYNRSQTVAILEERDRLRELVLAADKLGHGAGGEHDTVGEEQCPVCSWRRDARAILEVKAP